MGMGYIRKGYMGKGYMGKGYMGKGCVRKGCVGSVWEWGVLLLQHVLAGMFCTMCACQQLRTPT